MSDQLISSRQIPMVIVAIFFIAGILFNDLFYIDQIVLWVVIVILCSVYLAFLIKSDWTYQSLAVMALIFATGYTHSSYQKSFKKKGFNLPEVITQQHLEYTAEIVKSTESDKFINLRVNLRGVQLSPKYIKSLSSIPTLVKVKRSDNIQKYPLGQAIIIKTKLHKIKSEKETNGFNYQSFLEKQGIRFLCYTESEFITLSPNQSHALYKIIRYKVRNHLLRKVDSLSLRPQTKAITKALLLGYKNELNEETLQSFRDSGTMHILAVSGLHVGIVALLLFKILNVLFFFFPKYSTLKLLLLTLGLIFFAELTGSAPPVWRASLMTILYLIGRTYSYHAHSLNLIGTAAVILLLIDSQVIYNLSFQLSFTAVIGIILIFPILEKLYFPKNKIAVYSIGIVYMGISAQIAIAPISLYYFNQISLLSSLTSIIAITVAFVIIVIGGILLSIGGRLESISNMLSELMDISISILQNCSHFMSEIYGSIVSHVYLTIVECVTLSIAITFFLLSYYSASKKFLTLSIALFAIQGFHHSIIGIQHSKCVEIIYSSDTTQIQEIFVGRRAFLLNNNTATDYKITEKRKYHRILSFKTLDSIPNI